MEGEREEQKRAETRKGEGGGVSQEFLRSATKGLRAVTMDDCDGMPALCALLPSPLLCSPTSLPTSSSLHPLSERTPGGAAQTKPSLQQSFAGKLLTKLPEAERLPDTTKHARVSLPLALPPVLFLLNFSLSFLAQSPPSFTPTTFPSLMHCSRLTFRQWKPAPAEVADWAYRLHVAALTFTGQMGIVVSANSTAQWPHFNLMLNALVPEEENLC